MTQPAGRDVDLGQSALVLLILHLLAEQCLFNGDGLTTGFVHSLPGTDTDLSISSVSLLHRLPRIHQFLGLLRGH